VRTAALEPLFALEGHGMDPLLRSQLQAEDPQLLMTAARLLTDSPDRPRVTQDALDAFTRISEAERETWRDPRIALLDLIEAVGGRDESTLLEPFLLDYDATVANRVAEVLEQWNGRPFLATPIPLPPMELPNAQELEAMDGARIALHMRVGGTIEIALDPYLAITNVARFVRLVDQGYFDGLTFHRWVPNFVIQGGSPGANEYQGDGPYTRDEVGLQPHWRGTVGISTRGHDSGDGQIFVNLMDNVRLDHTYTVIGTVVSGMEVVDRVVEGSVIERAELIRAP
jgi:cyclophilin family peptidyl-prolyl cis-trans isomerase